MAATRGFLQEPRNFPLQMIPFFLQFAMRIDRRCFYGIKIKCLLLDAAPTCVDSKLVSPRFPLRVRVCLA